MTIRSIGIRCAQRVRLAASMKPVLDTEVLKIMARLFRVLRP
jgi:hypothetical protein